MAVPGIKVLIFNIIGSYKIKQVSLLNKFTGFKLTNYSGMMSQGFKAYSTGRRAQGAAQNESKTKLKKETTNSDHKLKKLITTADGSHTIFVPELDEHYHSIHGAVQESLFIFINNGFNVCTASPLNIFEVGFGTGLNALLTALESEKGERTVNYHSIEKYPLDKSIINSLNHHKYAGEKGLILYNAIHSSPWNENVGICRNFNLHKISGDITSDIISGNYDLIYFDAFGPDKQPEMWSRQMFKLISAITNKNGIFLTYSAKGEVKRNLRLCGFEVLLLPGPPGKRQIIRAIKL